MGPGHPFFIEVKIPVNPFLLRSPPPGLTARSPGRRFRDEFAGDSLLQRGVCKLLVPKPGESPEHLSTLWKSCMRFCVYLLLPIEPELFSRADRAIECHPGHHLGVRELAAA